MSRLHRPFKTALCTARLACLTALVLSACAAERTYEVRGRVVGFSDDLRSLIVEHEEIQGYMPSMTMPFEVLDTAEVADLAVGDAVAFELVVDRRTSHIRKVMMLPDDALPRHPAGTPVPQAMGTSDFIAPGDPLPSAAFITHADTSLTLSDLRGRPVLLTFIYVRCPIPDFCPLMSRNFAELQERLDDDAIRRIHLLSISFDPANDTPEVLREYAARYTDDLSNWTFATGDSAVVHQFAERLGLFYSPDGEQIIHNLVTVLADEHGVVQEIWRGNDWRPDDVLRAAERNRSRTN